MILGGKGGVEGWGFRNERGLRRKKAGYARTHSMVQEKVSEVGVRA